MTAEIESVFTGCNRNLGIFSYNENYKVVAYGSHNTVSISSPILTNNGEYNVSTQVIKTLKNHTGEVTTVKWIQASNLLVSGCQDGIVNIWKSKKENEEDIKFELLQALKPTMGSISCIGLVNNDPNCMDLIVGDSHGIIYYYKYDIEIFKFKEICKFELPYGFYAMTLNIIKISDAEIIILCGGSKPLIHVLSIDLRDLIIKLETSLPGHDDWVRSMDVCELTTKMETVENVTYPKRTFIFASASLDRIIRLWKLTIEPSNTPVYIETNKLKLLTSKEYKFETKTNRCCLFLNAILMGHDDWVSEVSWKSNNKLTNEEEDLMLLSSSADSSIMIWKSDPISGVWFPEVRLGEMAIKGASTATGSSGGFYTSKWIIDPKIGTEIILTNGKTGSFRCWVKDKQLENIFNSRTSFTGPIKSISDISWSINGDYLLATSLDQSTRLFCKWNNKWFEFGRPQIHGFDMITIKSINSTRFVSGGDEKVIRVFDMPKNIANMLNKNCGLECLKIESLDNSLPESASLPVLGLSNKAAFDDNNSNNGNANSIEDNNNNNNSDNIDEGDESNKEINNNIMNNIKEPLNEDILQRHTLWPEIEKLYGHGFEITTLDVSHDGKIIASACRSNISKHAVIRNFNTETWLECPKTLTAHDLTITRLRFSLYDENSLNNEYLLSVSRDRKFSLWERDESSENFKLIKIMEKAHSRIIWDCAWVNYGNVISFVTCSRDKEVKLWKREGDEVNCKGNIKFSNSAVTAIDSIKINNEGNFKLVIGLDNGEIYIYQVDVAKEEFEELEIISEDQLPGDGITRISISPKTGANGKFSVAIGSKDNSLRLLNV
jgi:elongator complex protein 2